MVMGGGGGEMKKGGKFHPPPPQINDDVSQPWHTFSPDHFFLWTESYGKVFFLPLPPTREENTERRGGGESG